VILVRSMKCCFISFCKWVMKKSELKHHHHPSTGYKPMSSTIGPGVGCGGGTFVIFANILLIVLTKSWRALFFSFWFQIEEEVPSTELSCYGFKTQGMNFYVPSDF